MYSTHEMRHVLTLKWFSILPFIPPNSTTISQLRLPMASDGYKIHLLCQVLITLLSLEYTPHVRPEECLRCLHAENSLALGL